MAWLVGLVDRKGRSEVQQDGRCVNKYMRKYLVRTDAAIIVTEADVAGAVGIARGSPCPFDLQATCYSLEVTPVGVMTRPPYQAFFATYEWATNAALPEQDDNDPTTMRTIWTISPQITSRYIIKDRNDVLIVNAASTPYDGGIPVDVRLASATAERSIDAAGYDKATVVANSGKLNSATYLGAPPGTLQVDISAKEKYEGGFHFWSETYTFSYDPEGWQPKPLNCGLYHRVDGLPKRLTYEDLGETGNTKFIEEPEPLDEDGLLIPFGPANRPSLCNYVTVDYYDTMDFNDFNL